MLTIGDVPTVQYIMMASHVLTRRDVDDMTLTFTRLATRDRISSRWSKGRKGQCLAGRSWGIGAQIISAGLEL